MWRSTMSRLFVRNVSLPIRSNIPVVLGRSFWTSPKSPEAASPLTSSESVVTVVKDSVPPASSESVVTAVKDLVPPTSSSSEQADILSSSLLQLPEMFSNITQQESLAIASGQFAFQRTLRDRRRELEKQKLELITEMQKLELAKQKLEMTKQQKLEVEKQKLEMTKQKLEVEKQKVEQAHTMEMYKLKQKAEIAKQQQENTRHDNFSGDISKITEELLLRNRFPVQSNAFVRYNGEIVRFPLNRKIAEVMTFSGLSLVEGAPGEGKYTQVMRTILEARPNHTEEERPLILFASLRTLKPEDDPYSFFFTGLTSMGELKVEKCEELLLKVITQALKDNRPVYVVVGDVQQLVDNSSPSKHTMFGFFLNLLLQNDQSGKLKVVYIASRLFSSDLKKFSGHQSRFETCDLKGDTSDISSGLKQCKNIFGRRADDLFKVFGNRIRDYVTFDEEMAGRVDEERYDEVMEKMKNTKSKNIETALQQLSKLYGNQGRVEGTELLNKLSEEGELSDTNEAPFNVNIVEELQSCNVVLFDAVTLTWATQFTSVVYAERFMSNKVKDS